MPKLVSDRLPSLNALRMFEAAARHRNFTRAAERLCVTQGAVSRQIKNLEEDLGEALFLRDGPRVELTAAGVRLYDAVQEAFGLLRRSTLEFRRRAQSATLTISVLPSFAAKWLVPRLIEFQSSNSDIDVRLSASYDVVDFSLQPDVDVAIRFSADPPAGLYHECIISEQLFPVCSPKLLGSARSLDRVDDIAKFPLIRALEPYDQWNDWFRAAGVNLPVEQRGPRYSDALILLRAAVEGQGIALVRALVAAEDLEAGRLLRISELTVASRHNYYFVCPGGA